MKNINKKFPIFILISLCAFIAGCTSINTELPATNVVFTDTPPEIDGNIDDACWENASRISGLKSSRGKDYQERIDKIPTNIRLLWNEENLFIAFECIDDKIFSTGKLKHDDDLYKEDVCEVFIDGKGDGRQYVEIQVNPAGENLDLMYVFSGTPEYTSEMRMTQEFCDTNRWGFREWDMEGLRTAGKIIYQNGNLIGWNVEMAIPAKLLVKRNGFKKFSPETELRANFMRYDWQDEGKTGKRKLIHMNWSPVMYGCPHISPALMGKLILINSKKRK